MDSTRSDSVILNEVSLWWGQGIYSIEVTPWASEMRTST